MDPEAAFPAHAGMNRLKKLHANPHPSVPRTRGDEPHEAHLLNKANVVVGDVHKNIS